MVVEVASTNFFTFFGMDQDFPSKKHLYTMTYKVIVTTSNSSYKL